VMTEAELVNEERTDIQRTLSLDRTVEEAVQANLDLLAADRMVAAGEEAVKESRAPLLPQIGLSAGGTQIDSDRAAVSSGLNPEKTFSGTVTGSMVLYSEKAWAGYTVEKYLQESRLEGREALRLDITQAAATAYLNVLRTQAYQRIQKEYLHLTRSNLERARIRRSIGVAGPEEVYRWESEIAGSRQAVLYAESATMDTMNAVNRLLHRPIDEEFTARETELDDPLLALVNRQFLDLVENPKGFRDVRSYLVAQGFALSPELKELDALIAAQDRLLVASKRSFWLPDFFLKADVTEWFDYSGAGADMRPLTGLNDTDWSVGIYASIPLFSGGERLAATRRNREELTQLEIQRQAAAERIEEAIHHAVNRTRASYPSIRLSRQAEEAAGKNLELVSDSYEEGVISIINLIDAQTNALASDERAADAVYDFLIDLMAVQRAVGTFFVFMDPAEQREWLAGISTMESK
jgi:outer membrane protein